MARKLSHCDGCGKRRGDVRTIGHDANGDADGPDMCFLCRQELIRGRIFDLKTNKYVRPVVHSFNE